MLARALTRINGQYFRAEVTWCRGVASAWLRPPNSWRHSTRSRLRPPANCCHTVWTRLRPPAGHTPLPTRRDHKNRLQHQSDQSVRVNDLHLTDIYRLHLSNLFNQHKKEFHAPKSPAPRGQKVPDLPVWQEWVLLWPRWPPAGGGGRVRPGRGHQPTVWHRHDVTLAVSGFLWAKRSWLAHSRGGAEE